MADYMTFTNTFDVHSIERLKNSISGNPRFLFIFDDGFTQMATPVNAGWAHAIVPEAIVGTTIRVKYRTPKKSESRLFDYEILGIA